MNPFSQNEDLNAENLKEIGLPFGWTETEKIRRYSTIHPLLERNLPRAIIIMFPLSSAIIDSIADAPNVIYQHHYRTVNRLLDIKVAETGRWIEASGFKALPAPATISVDPFHGHLSHKVAAALAGLGWIGKSTLLATPEYGARVRLVSVLTDLPLPDNDKIMKDGCGDCRDCVDICPVGAIGETFSDFKVERCWKYIMSLIKKGIVEEQICGMCVKACRGRDE